MGDKMEKIIKCQMCGCDVVTTIATKKYCIECANKRNREKTREYHRRNKKKNKQEDEEVKKQLEQMIPPRKKPKYSINDIVRMSMAAGKSGINYGRDVVEIESREKK